MNRKDIKTSYLLFDGKPLIIRPELACRIGLNEAIVLQQVHYWLETKKDMFKGKKLENEHTYRNGMFWTYNTYQDWQLEFPFWSTKTIQRTFKSLEEMGIILSTSEFNKMSTDKTKWYSIDYNRLDEIKSLKDAKNFKKSKNKSEKITKKEKTNVKKDNNVDNVENVDNVDIVGEMCIKSVDAVDEYINFEQDNLTKCDIEHLDNLSSSNVTNCPNGQDNLSSSIPKSSLTKNTNTKNTKNIFINSSSSSLEINEEEYKKLKDKILESNIMRNEQQVLETLEICREKGLSDFQEFDIIKAINHYTLECEKQKIACPPIYFANGLEMVLNKKHTNLLGLKNKKDTKHEFKMPKEIPQYNWVD